MTDSSSWALSADEQATGKIANQLHNITLSSNSIQGGDATYSSNGLTGIQLPSQEGSGDNWQVNEDEQEPHCFETEPTRADVSLIQKLLRNRLVTTRSDLEILQKDPNSPLYSVRTFEALHLKPQLLKGIYDMGFNTPSKIQETALPVLLANPPQNMIAQSQSGTGKTAAFVLTMLSRTDTSLDYPQCICLAPTYELALQIGAVTRQMAKYMPDVRIRYAVRGERVEKNQKLDDHIIIGTPGTMMDWCMRYRVIDLKLVKVFVLDEADVMIDTQGHQDQSIRIQKGLKPDCQMLLFSATYDHHVMKFAQAIVQSNTMTIRLRREEESLDNIKQVYVHCPSKEKKYEVICNIYGTLSIGQSMIFCHTRKTASWLSEQMTRDGHAVALLSGELTVEQRAAVIQRYREGKEKVLITTNVSARGRKIEKLDGTDLDEIEKLGKKKKVPTATLR